MLAGLFIHAQRVEAGDPDRPAETCDQIDGGYSNFAFVNGAYKVGDSRPIERKPDGSVVFKPIFNCVPYAFRFSISDPNTNETLKAQETDDPNDYVEFKSDLSGGVSRNGRTEFTHQGWDEWKIASSFINQGTAFAQVPGTTEIPSYVWEYDNGAGLDFNVGVGFFRWSGTIAGTGKQPSMFVDSGYTMVVEIFDNPLATSLPVATYRIPFGPYEDNSLLSQIRRRLSIDYWLDSVSDSAATGGTRASCAVWKQGAGVNADVCLELADNDKASTGQEVLESGRLFQSVQRQNALVTRNLSGDIQVAGPLFNLPRPVPELVSIDLNYPSGNSESLPCWRPGSILEFTARWHRTVRFVPRDTNPNVDPTFLALRFDWIHADGQPQHEYAFLAPREQTEGFSPKTTMVFQFVIPDREEIGSGFNKYRTREGDPKGIHIRTAAISAGDAGPFYVMALKPDYDPDPDDNPNTPPPSEFQASPLRESDRWIVGQYAREYYGNDSDAASVTLPSPEVAFENPGQGCMSEREASSGLGNAYTFTGVVTGTPARLTYERGWVVAGWTTTLNLVYAILVIIIAWIGLTIIAQQHLGGQPTTMREMIPRLVFGLIAAATSYWWCRLLVDLADSVSRYVSISLHVTPGDVLFAAKAPLALMGHVGSNLPGTDITSSVVDYGAAGGVLVGGASMGLGMQVLVVILLLIYLVFGLLILMQMVMRLVMINLLIVLAPIGMAMWILPQTASWGRTWLQMWMVQLWQHALQLIGLSLAMSYMRGVGWSSPQFEGGMTTVVWLLILSVAALYLTYKIPRLIGDQGLSEGFLTTTFMAFNLAGNIPRTLGTAAKIGSLFATGGASAGALAAMQTFGFGMGSTTGGFASRMFNVMTPGSGNNPYNVPPRI